MARTVNVESTQVVQDSTASRRERRHRPEVTPTGAFNAGEVPPPDIVITGEELEEDFAFLNTPAGDTDNQLHLAKARVKSMKGRPGIYEPSVHPRMGFLILSKGGFTLQELAETFDVPYGTLLSWIHRYKEFATALQMGRDVWYSTEVEKTLFKKALGYEYEETETSRVPVYEYEHDDKGKPHAVITGYENVITKRVRKQAQPETAALLFILQNRMPDRWKNTRFVHIDNKSSVTHAHAHLHVGGPSAPTQEKIVNLSTEQLLQLETMAQQMGIIAENTTAPHMEADYAIEDDFSIDCEGVTVAE